jgi:4-amino-4-deoxy-L-arabinose transferase-like glycosyltransferase
LASRPCRNGFDVRNHTDAHKASIHAIVTNLGNYLTREISEGGTLAQVRVVATRLAYSPAFIACFAFAFRIAILYIVWQRMRGSPEATDYGFEVGRVARSIVTGKGFSSPLIPLETGPTAYLCPLYPYLVATVFRFFGIYSVPSHIILQTLNCAFAALVVFGIYAIAKRSFGTDAAIYAAWIWVFLPNAWHIPIAYVWDSTLSALWFTLVFWATLVLRGNQKLFSWAFYGALWAIGAMINATILSLFLPIVGWLAWSASRRSLPWLQYASVTCVVLVLGMAPWSYRNYKVFGRFIPVRSNFGIMLWEGSNPIALDVNSFALQPVWSLPEAELYKRMGEIPYMKSKEREALAFMRSHPRSTIKNILRKVGANWFEVSDRPHSAFSEYPFYLKMLWGVNVLFVLLAWMGTVSSLRAHNEEAVPYLFVLVFYPLVYYLTSTLVRYRFPIEPLLTVLAAYGFLRIWNADRQNDTSGSSSIQELNQL